MDELKQALRAFAAAQLDYAGLLRVLGASLRSDPAAAPVAVQLLDEALRAGELPPAIHADFLKRIDQFMQANPAAAARPAPPPPDDDGDDADDKTVMRAPAPPAEDKTRLSPGAHPGPHTGAQTGAQTGAHTGAHTGAQPGLTGGTGAPQGTGAGHTGQGTGTGGHAPGTSGYGTGTSGAGSSWGHPSQWTGGSGSGAPLAVDSVIKQRFVLQKEIGKGGMGVVFKALDLRKQEAHDRNPYIAVKVLNEEFKRHPESLKALQREARKAQDLAHPNIVNVFDFDRDGDDVYMTMEYLEGEPLDELIQKEAMTGLPKSEAFPIIRGMALALNYAHEKAIIHSDFKPANCFLNREGVVKVFDFGIARAATRPDEAEGEKTMFDAGTLGALTPAYASCEMLDGDEPDQRDDIYALGCTAYELLAGKHPFGKKKATVARGRNMVPPPIKGLNKREFRALTHALAFNRHERTQSAVQFLNELIPKKSQKGLVVGASAAAAVLLAVLGGVVIPPWMHERKMEQYITALRDGGDDEIWRVLPEVLDLSQADQADIFGSVKDRVMDAYERRINEQVDASRGLYDYPAAERFVSELRSLFTDSQRVSSIATRIDEGKRQEELRQTTRYNEFLAEGRLLPRPDEQDITDVLAIVRQVSPDSSLLTDPRLSGAYAAAAEVQIENDRNLGLASQLLEAGLVEFPGDPSMVNLLDEVRAKQRRVQMAQRISELEIELAAALPSVTTIADIASISVPFEELIDLDASAATLAPAQTKVQSLIATELASRVERREWVQASGLLQRYSVILGEAYVQDERTRINAAEDAHTERMATLFDEFLRAVQAGNLASPVAGNAQAILQQLDAAGASDAMLLQARSGLGQAYLSRAREARATGEFEEARSQVQLGLEAQPGETLERSLAAETAEIDLAERQQQTMMAEADRARLEQERQQRIETLRAEFQQGLRDETFRSETAGTLLQTLDQLAAVSPTDPLLANGRAEVGKRLSEQARAAAAAGEWDNAIGLATDSLAVLPDSELLAATLSELRAQRAQGERQAQAQQIQQLKDQLEALLAAPQYNDNWDNDVRNRLQSLAATLPANDPYLSARRGQAARLYLGQATERRLEQRFSEANAMLDRASRFAPGLAELETERATVQAAKSQFEAERAQQNRLAKLEGDKQTFRVEARADSVTKAKATLASLRAELPKDDVFLTQEAPKELGDAYERLAARSAERNRFDTALKFADAGLEFVPDRDTLKTARANYERRNNSQRVSTTLSSGTAAELGALSGLLAKIKAAEDDYPRIEREFAAVLAQRVRRLENTDYQQAEGLLAAGRQLFSGNATLASLKISPPAAAAPTAAVTPRPAPAASPPAAQPAPVVTATAPKTVSTRSKSQKPCSTSLAGYGRRGRGVCYDALPGDTRGPDLVVVPAGGGGSVFAITRYEITAGEYEEYCRISGECSYSALAADMPLTDVSIAQAEKFSNWLSSVTGASYRLPTASEWEYAAGANGNQPGRDFNCQIRDTRGQLVKGLGLVSVNSGDRNGWGLYNYVGNAQEWVRTGGSVTARGGAYNDSLSNCEIALSRKHSGEADPVTGFRLVRVIE